MQENFFSVKRIVVVLLVGIGIWILIPKIIGLKETIDLLHHVKLWPIILALVSEGFFYVGSAVLTKAALQMTKEKLKFLDVLKISSLDSFSVQFLPLGTFGETLVDYYFYRSKNVRTSHIILMFIARTIIVWLVFAFIFLFGVALSPTNHEIGADRLLIIWLIYFGGFAFLFYLIYLYRTKEKLLKKALNTSNFLNKIIGFLHLHIPIDRIPGLIDKIYETTNILARTKKLQVLSVTGALLYWFGDIFCLYFAFISFGYQPHLPIVIFAYCVTKILATISFIPGGLGIAEASLSLIFIGFGVPSSTALAAVLIFRLISFWLPIPVGLWAFLSLQKNYIKMKLGMSNTNEISDQGGF